MELTVKSIRLWRAVLLLGCFGSLGASAQQATLTAETQLIVRVQYLSGAPLSDLRAKDFHVSAGGQVPLSLAVLSTAIPPAKVLLMIAPQSPYTDVPSVRQWLSRSLPSALSGTELSVVLPNRCQTAYTAQREEMLRELDTPGKSESWIEALRSLAPYRGQKAILYVTAKNANVLPEVWRAAKDMGAQIYHVGGDVFRNYSSDGQYTSVPSLPSYGQGLYGASSGPPTAMTVVNPVAANTTGVIMDIGVVREERSLRGALHDLTDDRRGYYSLAVVMPTETPSITLKVMAKRDYRVQAEAYRSNALPSPEVVLAVGR